MNRSTPGLPVHHQLPEFTQTHVHGVGDAIQPSHPLSSPSPPAPNPSQHQSLFQWGKFRMRWPKYWSFSFSISPTNEHPGLICFIYLFKFYFIFKLYITVLVLPNIKMNPPQVYMWTGWISLQSKGHSRVFSNTTVQKYQFFGTQLSSQSNSYIHTWPQEKPQPCLDGPLLVK